MEGKQSSILSLSGRVNRATFWGLFFLTFGGPLLVLPLMDLLPDFAATTIFLALYALAIWVWLATVVKRFHDLGITGWAALFIFIPIVNLFAFLLLGFGSGDDGENEYGSQPT